MPCVVLPLLPAFQLQGAGEGKKDKAAGSSSGDASSKSTGTAAGAAAAAAPAAAGGKQNGEGKEAKQKEPKEGKPKKEAGGCMVGLTLVSGYVCICMCLLLFCCDLSAVVAAATGGRIHPKHAHTYSGYAIGNLLTCLHVPSLVGDYSSSSWWQGWRQRSR